MKQSTDHQLTVIYFFVDNYCKQHPAQTQWCTSNNGGPLFTDSEVLTIALKQSYFGCATLKQTYQLVKANAAAACPHLCSYQQGLARLHALSPLLGRLVLASAVGQLNDYYLLDSKPIPLCHPVRHGRVRWLREAGAWFSKSTKGWFFGCKLHAIVNQQGLLVGAIFTPANTDDRDPALALAWSAADSLALANLGYRSEELREWLAEEAALLLLTPADAPKPQRALLSSLRERVETSFSQLWSRFVDLIYSRAGNDLWNTIKLNMLYFNLCQSGLITP